MKPLVGILQSVRRAVSLDIGRQFSMPPVARKGLLLPLAVFCGQLFMAFAVIPPWQNPDEPQHLLTTRLIVVHGADFVLHSDQDEAGERAIIASMAQYRWWEHYGEQTPNPLPATFADGPAKVVKDYFGPPAGGSRLYYSGVAAIFRVAGITKLLSQFYTMRFLSALWSLLTLVCVWAGTLALFDARSAVVVTGLMALHPQFVLVSTTASPDAFVNLAGAAMWWQAAVLLTSRIRVRNVMLLLTASVLGFMTRRMGAMLVIIALCIIAAAIARAVRAREWRRRPWWAAVAASSGVAALAGTAWFAMPLDVYRAVAWIRFDPLQSASTITANAGDFPAFLEMLFRTFWLSAGWLRYSGPGWWQVATIALTVLTAAGLFASIVKAPSCRPAVWLGGGMVLLQTAAVVAYCLGIVQSGPQGRYLFPVLPAVFCLVWLGWRGMFGERQSLAAVLGLAVMAFLNISAWTLVIFPAYA
jgi:hypothetical protein